MNTVTEKIEQFLTQHPDNHVCVSQGGRRLGKTTMPKYSFTLADIQNIYGTVADFVKSLPENGFVSDVKINLRSVTGFGASQRTTVKETLTLNFKKETPMQEAIQPIPATPTVMQPQQPSYPSAMPTPFYGGLAAPQMQLHDIVSGTVAKERLEDKIKECQKLTDENLDLKSEVRSLKEQLTSLQIKLDTANDRHELALEKERLNQKGFMDSETGKMLASVGGRLAAAYMGAQMRMPGEAVAALAAPNMQGASNLSEIKQELIAYISSDAVSDELATQLLNQIYVE
ncbi:hypothetical protein ACILE2_10930 [Capnocytophaga canimorsus]|uniref:hypothetical protein n=1 Tax=Capnocytophaga canimorsus TaxID=28188 RepID=UPI0037D90BBB